MPAITTGTPLNDPFTNTFTVELSSVFVTGISKGSLTNILPVFLVVTIKKQIHETTKEFLNHIRKNYYEKIWEKKCKIYLKVRKLCNNMHIFQKYEHNCKCMQIIPINVIRLDTKGF